MKKFTLSFFLVTITHGFFAQQAILDSVQMGPSYVNEVYYILNDGTQSEQAANDWHLGFITDAFSASIISNAASATVKMWPNGTNADFETVDTTGFSTWPTLANDSIVFDQGSFNSNTTGGMDYGWGAYNTSTHMVTGDSVYLVKVGTAVYKLDIVNRTSGTYNLRYADVSTAAGTIVAVDASTYSTKELVFFNLEDGLVKDRELENWDLWAVKFHDYYGTSPNQVVTGILTNPKWEVSVVDAGAGNQASHTDFSSGSFSADKNELGSSYKSLNASFQWVVTDSKVYYLQNAEGDVWKWYPTSFVGTSAGKTVFYKQQMALAGVATQEISFLDVYPNPVKDQLTLSFDSKAPSATVEIYNSLGQVVTSESFQSNAGMTHKTLSTAQLNAGVYFVILHQNGTSVTQKIVKQ